SERASDLRFLESLVDQISARLDGKTGYKSPWVSAFSLGRFDEPDAGYFFSADRHWLFMMVKDDGDYAARRQPIASIRRAIAGLPNEFPEVRAGVTGGPAISNDEMTAALHDSRMATALAFALTLTLLISAFRRVTSPLLILGSLTLSLAW